MTSAQRRLAQLRALWDTERVATRHRFVEQRRGTTLKQRVSRGIALADLAIDEADAATGGRTMLWLFVRTAGTDLGDLRIKVGDPVRLWWSDPEGDDVVTGVLGRRSGDRVAVVVDGDVPERLYDGGFRLDVDDPDATFRRGFKALDAFANAAVGHRERTLREVLLGDAEPAFDGLLPVDDPALNPSQQLAVAKALAARDVALIHGPPGTGKTTTLAAVIDAAARRGQRVLATAASNMAVDNLAEKLIGRGLRVVRLGHPARVAGAVLGHTLDAQLEQAEEVKLARKWIVEAQAIRRRTHARRDRGSRSWAEHREQFAEANRLFRDARRQLRAAEQLILERASVVCATAAGADSRVLGGKRYDVVVVDEATQAPDPIALVALARAQRCVLAGDPCQLPPTIIDHGAARSGLGETIFERLARRLGDQACTLLMVQYRMHADLMAFPSASMYDGHLQAAPSVAAHRLADLPGVDGPDPLRPGPLVFIDTAGKGWEEERDEQSDDPSTSNRRQGQRLVAEVRRCIERGVAPDDIAVITPYYAQRRLLANALAAEVMEGLEVGTVDSFQGREKEAVFVDLVRSNPGGELGFLKDVRRMNVAITRARRFLMVLGDSATLGGHRYYAAFMEAAERSGSYLSAWSDDP